MRYRVRVSGSIAFSPSHFLIVTLIPLRACGERAAPDRVSDWEGEVCRSGAISPVSKTPTSPYPLRPRGRRGKYFLAPQLRHRALGRGAQEIRVAAEGDEA